MHVGYFEIRAVLCFDVLSTESLMLADSLYINGLSIEPASKAC